MKKLFSGIHISFSVNTFIFIFIFVLTNKILFSKEIYNDKYFQSSSIKGAFNQEYSLKIKDPFNLFTYVAFILLQPKQKGLDLANYADNNNTTRMVKFNFNYVGGFKIGIGTKTSFDNWDINSKYIRVSSKETTKKTSLNSNLSPYWSYENSLSSRVDGSWLIKLNLLDIELGRSYFLGEKLIAKPIVGTNIGFIDQRLKATYVGNSVNVAKNKSDSFLIGPKMGFFSSFILGKGFKIASNVSSSLLYQSSKVKIKENKNSSQLIFAKEKFSNIIPEVDISLNLTYGKYFIENKLHSTILIGYEFISFFNQNKTRSLIETIYHNINGKQEDLTFQGYTFAIKLAF